GGVSQTYTITVKNTGTQTWNATGTQIVRLGVEFGTASDWPHEWGERGEGFYLPYDGAPGQSVTMTVTVTPPNTAGPSVRRPRVVKENVAWFQQIQKTNVTANTLAPAYSSNPPTNWQAGQTRNYSVTVTNTGTLTWNATGTQIVRLGVEFGTASDWPH